MHKIGSCLQKPRLRGDPRLQALSWLLDFLLGNSLLGDEHVLSVSEVAIQMNAMIKIHVCHDMQFSNYVAW
jgi:hypothetical protein